MKSLSSSLECLEARIAPAALLNIAANKLSATYTDVDGDKVTVYASKPILTADKFAFLPTAAGDIGGQLALFDLHNDPSAANVSVAFVAARDRVAHVGDGLVNVGRIDATGLDLGGIYVSGDLASLTAGDATLTTPALSVGILVGSSGAYGLATEGATLNNVSTTIGWNFTGKTGPAYVYGNFLSSISVTNGAATIGYDANATLTSVAIGGNLVGGDGTLRGSDGLGTGFIFSEGPMGTVMIGGSVIGGSAAYGGSISSSSSISGVMIGGSVIGGTASDTGLILAAGPLGGVLVNGSLVGGISPVDNTGAVTTVIDSAGAIGSSLNDVTGVKVVGDVVPGTGTFSGTIFTSPSSHAKIGGVYIGGTLYGYKTLTVNSTTTEQVVNGIYSDGQLGASYVGAISGNSPASPAQITAHGVASPSSVAAAQAIASITVGRGMYAGEILAGYNSLGVADNPDVQIGSINIGLDFIGSSIASGTTHTTHGIGDAANTIATPGTGYTDTSLLSSIASVTIGRSVNGNPFRTASFDTGIVAQQIGAVTIGAESIELTASKDVFGIGVTPGFYIREVA